jgi:hypothetical protein
MVKTLIFRLGNELNGYANAQKNSDTIAQLATKQSFKNHSL